MGKGFLFTVLVGLLGISSLYAAACPKATRSLNARLNAGDEVTFWIRLPDSYVEMSIDSLLAFELYEVVKNLGLQQGDLVLNPDNTRYLQIKGLPSKIRELLNNPQVLWAGLRLPSHRVDREDAPTSSGPARQEVSRWLRWVEGSGFPADVPSFGAQSERPDGSSNVDSSQNVDFH